MSEMIERVAKAICAAYSNDPWDNLDAHWLRVYRTEARAAIESMREPTGPMLSVGSDLMWRAMIDEALK
jgi:hypothetical protein